MKCKILIFLLLMTCIVCLIGCTDKVSSSIDDPIYIDYDEFEYEKIISTSEFSKTILYEEILNSLKNIKFDIYVSFYQDGGSSLSFDSIGFSKQQNDGSSIGISKSKMTIQSGIYQGSGTSYSYVKNEVAYFSINQNIKDILENKTYSVSGKYHLDFPKGSTDMDMILGSDGDDDFLSINDVFSNLSSNSILDDCKAEIYKNSSFLGNDHYKICFKGGMFSGFTEAELYLVMNGKKFVGAHYQLKYNDEALKKPIFIICNIKPYNGDIDLPDLSSGYEKTFEEYSKDIANQMMK